MQFIPKPWGHETVWARTEQYIGKLLFIAPWQNLSFQYHEKKDETIYVLSGNLVAYVEDQAPQTKVYQEGETFRVRPGVRHQFGALGEPATLIEVSTPEFDDVVRLRKDRIYSLPLGSESSLTSEKSRK